MCGTEHGLLDPEGTLEVLIYGSFESFKLNERSYCKEVKLMLQMDDVAVFRLVKYQVSSCILDVCMNLVVENGSSCQTRVAVVHP